MTDTNGIPGMDADIPTNAIRLYGQDDNAGEDFPVLKAFQQYIDAEQAKARKRLLTMGIFFGVFTFIIIAIFVVLLIHVTERNQTLNDRMIEYAMQERAKPAPVPVVQPAPQDNAAMQYLTTKLDDMQKQLKEAQEKAERVAAEAAAKAPSPQELEIVKLKAQLEAEKQKAEEEKARAKEQKRQEELEMYRRTHYPELYERPTTRRTSYRSARRQSVDDIIEDIDKTLKTLDDNDAVSYFDSDEEDDEKPVRKVKKTKPRKQKQTKAAVEAATEAPSPSAATAPQNTTPPPKDYSVPVDIRGSSSSWRIPNE